MNALLGHPTAQEEGEPPTPEAIMDTGSSGHYFGLDTQLLDTQLAQHPINVELPDKSLIQSSHTGYLPIDILPKEACLGHQFPKLHGTSLISIGLLCDYGCEATFYKDQAIVRYQDHIILHGKRDASTHGLWLMEIPSKKLALSITNFSASKPELVTFSHACLWSPVPSTVETALKLEYLAANALPGLTLESLRKYTPNSEATIKGHMDNERKNTRSTQKKEDPEDPSDEKKEPKSMEQHFFEDEEHYNEDTFPEQQPEGKRSHLCFVKIVEITGQVHSDLTGRFPIPSSRGYHYLLVVYDYDSNSILFTPTKSRKAEELLRAYQSIHERLTRAGCKPQLQRLDNECSQAFKDFLRDEQIDFQLVPPDDH